jgi:hypothetical protein
VIKSLSNLHLPSVTGTSTLARRELSPRSTRDESLTAPSRTKSIPDTVGGVGTQVPTLSTATGASRGAAGADTFELGGVGSTTAGPGLPRGKAAAGSPAGFAPPAAPAIPGRSRVSEFNPFDASTLPTRGKGGVAAILEEVNSGGAYVPVGADRDARLAGIKSELDGQVGNYTGPDHTMGISSFAYDPNSKDPMGDAIKHVVVSGSKGVATGAIAGAGLAALLSDAGGALVGGAVGAVVGGVYGTVGGVVDEVVDVGGVLLDQLMAKDKAANDKNAEAKDKSKGTAESAPPPPPPKADEPKKEPPPPPPPPKKADDKKDAPDPMRGSGRNYEAWREVYLGHADGTGVGARGTAVGAGAANPRNTNPGRDRDAEDGPSQSSQTPSIGDLAMAADPMRGAKQDARAEKLMSQARVSGRHIITAPDAEENSGSGRPKANGLVR